MQRPIASLLICHFVGERVNHLYISVFQFSFCNHRRKEWSIRVKLHLSEVKMSFLQKMFGAGGKDKGMPTTGQAIQKLRETEEMLIKKQEFLEKKIDQELDIAKKNGTKNKRGSVL